MKKYSVHITVLVLCVGLLALAFNGCGPKPSTKTTDFGDKPGEDPWVKLATELRANNDTKSCSRVLTNLNMDLANRADIEQTSALTEADLAKIRAVYPLREHEVKDLSAQSYSKLDAHYLADAFYLSDIVKHGVDLTGLQNVDKAKVLFDWVCRQVVLSPWMINSQNAPLVPSSYVLRRSSGSGLERAIVYIDLCRQAGMTAYLIGPGTAKTLTWNSSPKGPFWGVGVQAGKNVLLFDPWRGAYVPGATPGRPATLAEVIKDPNVASVWLTDTKNKWDVTAKDLQDGTIFLVPAYSGFTPRMRTLEKKLPQSFGLKLYEDPIVALKDAEAANPGIKVQFWPGYDTGERAYANFLTTGEGGVAPAIKSSEQSELSYLRVAYMESLIPGSELKFDIGLGFEQPRAQLMGISRSKLSEDFYGSPFLRELIQRGHFSDAIEKLVKLREEYQTQLSQSSNVEKEVKAFVEDANRVYEKLNIAKPAEQAYALQDVKTLWTKQAKTVTAIVFSRIGKPGKAEATYLLAQCKHEEAELKYREWQQAKPEVQAALLKDLTQKLNQAKYWWETYQQYADTQEATYRGRAQHATKLTAVVQQRLIEVAK